MSTGEFFSLLGQWLLSEPVHHSMVLVLSFLTLFLCMYMLVAYHFMRSRLLSVELRYQGLIERITVQSSDITVLRRDTLDQIGEVREQVTNPGFSVSSDNDDPGKDEEDPFDSLDEQLDAKRKRKKS